MSGGGSGLLAERQWAGASKALRWIGDRLAVIGDDPGGMTARMADQLPTEPDVVTIVGQPAGLAAWNLVTELIALAVPPGSLARVVVSGAGGPVRDGGIAPAEELARRMDGVVEAPIGQVFLVPGGSLFAPGGWRRFGPDGSIVRRGRRIPAPDWEADVDLLIGDTQRGLVVDPLPAGLWVHAPGVGSPLAPLALGIPADPDRPVLLIGQPGAPEVSADDLAELVSALDPPPLLAPFGQSLASCVGPAGRVARRRRVPVETATGVPALDADGRLISVAVDADGGDYWRPVHTRLVTLPTGATRPVGPIDILAGFPQVSPRVYQLNARWVAEPTPGGIWVRPPFAGESASQVRDSPTPWDRFTLRVGLPGVVPGDDVLPVLHALIARLPPDTAKRLLVVPEDVRRVLSVGAASPDPGPDLAVATVRAGLPRWWQPDERLLSVLVEVDGRHRSLITDAGRIDPTFAGEIIAGSVRARHRAILLVSTAPVMETVQQLVADQTQRPVIGRAGPRWRVCRPRQLGAEVLAPIEANLRYPFDERELSRAVARPRAVAARSGTASGPLDLTEPYDAPPAQPLEGVALTAGPGVHQPFVVAGQPVSAWEVASIIGARRPGWVNRIEGLGLEIGSVEGAVVQLLANYLGTPISVRGACLADHAPETEAAGRIVFVPRSAPTVHHQEGDRS